jgi:membrane protein DedA with SNARE-associated domain
VSLSAAALTLPTVFLVAVVPLAPTEAVLIGCGVLAASGRLSPLPVVAVAALGCAVSDLVNYRVGRTVGGRALRRLRQRPSGRVAVDWLTRQVARHGGPILIAARFVPGGGIAGAVLTGALHWPVRRFLPVSAAGSILWTVYAVLIGYAGGTLVTDPVLGMLLSVAVAAALSVLAGALARASTPAENQPAAATVGSVIG